MRVEQKKAAELNYVEFQRNRTWPIALMIALLMFLLAAEYISPTEPTQTSVTAITLETGEFDKYRVDLQDQHLFIRLKEHPFFKVGDAATVFTSPVLKEIEKVNVANTDIPVYLGFHQYKYWPLAAGLMLVYTCLSAKFRWKFWFQSWIFGLILVFVTVLTFCVSR